MTNLEYRVNYAIDAVVQPSLSSVVETIVWMAIFASAGTSLIGGFGQEYYLAYAIWGAFIARITSSWMYEFRMIEEVDSGSLNSLLVRPLSFYEYYLSQLLGYKVITTAVSLMVPLFVSWLFKYPIQRDRLLPVLGLVTYYLILVHTMSFCIATLAFHFNRVHSLTVAKNLCLWLLSGELVPLDLMPEMIRKVLTALPFSSAVFVPVGYLTGRIGPEAFWNGWVSTTWGILGFSALAFVMWRKGIREYVGTGA